MDAALHLRLFGSPEETIGGDRLTGFITVKSRALLYYLAMKPGVHGRQTLATLLWPESSETSAGKNLRNALSNLRELVGPYLEITRQSAAFRRDAPYSLDVEQFAAFIERYRRGRQDVGDLESAASLYVGDFLDGFHVPDTALYESWMAAEREQLRQAQLEALYTVAAQHAAQGEFNAGLAYVARLLAMDNLSEMGVQLRMTVLARMGRRSEALAQYQRLHRLLDEELGVAPLADTTALYEQIRAGNIEPEAGQLEVGPSPIAGQPAEALPRQLQLLDWGEIPGPVPYYGREKQLQQLHEWLADDQSRLIAITGIGGVGKSTLAARLARELVVSTEEEREARNGRRARAPFETIVWRSLINAPPLEIIMRDWLMLLSGQQLVQIPSTVAEQVELLMAYLRGRRALFILDNFESLMLARGAAGELRPGYDDYRLLLERFANSEHQSCLLITSRELPWILARMQPNASQMRSLQLAGLPEETGVSLLRAQGLSGPSTRLVEVVQRYSGNPLALNLAANTIQTLLGGDIDLLLEETPVFGDIRDVLDDQFSRLTSLEEQMLTWLAIEREPVDIRTISDDLVIRPHKGRLLEALRSLHVRSLLEQVQGVDSSESGRTMRYTLQNVVMEYATNRLIEAVCREIDEGRVEWLHQVALMKAHTKEYVLESQRRLLLDPVAQWLAERLGKAGAEEKLHRLLRMAKADSALSYGYAGANLLHLFLALGVELRGADFSGLAVRQTDLRDAILHNVSFRDSDLSGTIFRDTFGPVVLVAFSPDGRLLAALTGDGAVTLWRLYEDQPHLILHRGSGFDLYMAFSPDGQLLACGGNDRVIRLWDVQTGRMTQQLVAHTGPISSILFNPGGNLLYSSSDDLTVGVWDIGSGQLLRQLPAPDLFTLAMAVSPDGKMLAEVGYDGKARLWQIEPWTLRRRLAVGHTKKLRSVAFSPDGKTLATGDEDNAVHVWQVSNGRRLASMRLHSNFVLSVAYHPDGTTLASASADKTVRLWNWREEHMLQVLPGGDNWVTTVAFSPDGRLLASGGYDCAVRLWQSDNGQMLHTWRGTHRTVNEVVYSPDGQLLASASFGEPVRLWDAESGRLLHTYQGHRGTVRRLAISPDNRTLFVSGDEAVIWAWDTHTGGLRGSLPVAQHNVRTLALSPDGRLLAAGAGLGQGTLYVGDTTTLHLRPRDDNIRTGLAANVCFSPDGHFIVYSDSASTLKMLDVHDNKVHNIPTNHEELIGNIRFSPDGTWLASQDRNGMLILWQVGAGGALTVRAYHRGAGPSANYWNLSFSPDSRHVSFQLDGGHVGILSTRDGRLQHIIAESLYGERCMAFSRDGSTLITSGEDGRLRLWDVSSGVRRATMQEAVLGTIAMNPKDGRVAGCGDDGVVRVWDIRTGTCEIALRHPGPYDGMEIAGAKGLSSAQEVTLRALGAVTARK